MSYETELNAALLRARTDGRAEELWRDHLPFSGRLAYLTAAALSMTASDDWPDAHRWMRAPAFVVQNMDQYATCYNKPNGQLQYVWFQHNHYIVSDTNPTNPSTAFNRSAKMQVTLGIREVARLVGTWEQQLPLWVSDWSEGEYNLGDPEVQGAIRTYATIPERHRDLMRAFPPMCVVRSKPGVVLRVPPPGRYAIVLYVVDPSTGKMSLALRPGPGVPRMVLTEAQDLEFVCPHRNMTAEFLEKLWEGTTP